MFKYILISILAVSSFCIGAETEPLNLAPVKRSIVVESIQEPEGSYCNKIGCFEKVSFGWTVSISGANDEHAYGSIENGFLVIKSLSSNTSFKFKINKNSITLIKMKDHGKVINYNIKFIRQDF